MKPLTFIFVFLLHSQVIANEHIEATKNCLQQFMSRPTTLEIDVKEDCRVSKEWYKKQNELLLEAALALGISSQKEQVVVPYYKQEKIHTFAVEYLRKEQSHLILTNYEEPTIQFDSKQQVWRLFFICKEKEIMTFGCHFTVIVDNEKIPGYSYSPGR